MDIFEQTRIAMQSLNEANNRPIKTEADVKKLKDQVQNIQKVVSAIFESLSEEQKQKVKSIINRTAKDT